MRRRVAVLLAASLLGTVLWPAAPASADPGDRFPTRGDLVEQAYADVVAREPDPGGLVYWRGALEAGTPPATFLDTLIHSSEHAGLIGPVIRLYYAAFGHDPDTGGLGYWLGQRRAGRSSADIAQAFSGTPEFNARYGAGSNAQFVDAVYQNVLGRPAEPGGRAYWIGRLDAGVPRPVVLLAISESPEHQSRRHGDVEAHQAYFALLRRVADVNGRTHWAGQINGGASPRALIAALYDSAEYAARFPRTPTLTVTPIVTGLTIPWGLAFAPDGTMLFTERPGTIKVRLANGTVRSLNPNLSDLFASGETGLMDLTLDADFASNRRFYTCQGNTPAHDIRVIAWTVDAGYTSATRVIDPLLAGLPLSSGRHGGCRLRSGTDGSLLVATGDAAQGTNAQNLGSLGGKVLRVSDTTGEGLPGNPFLGSPNANTRRIISYGHRNLQGLTYRANGQLWSAEHGSDCDDEINIEVIGANYGWDPVPGYNEDVPMTDTRKFPGARIAAWASGCPTIASSGIAFLDHPSWGAWRGHLAVAALKDTSLRVMSFTGGGQLLGQVVPDPLDDDWGRLRTAVLGPGGRLYVTTANGGGADRILEITPTVP
jgi:glucose/arabinose dehydrogenase